ncbi:HigA family addiction module antitoxin [Paraburkholderia tropica]|uniref:HigA family addiction module antitoxin n=1 Tax=Paraburkholderia tropica TaxID=92647 RepID=UPI002AB085B3|nr:HigA family addiction module antitoxin [Paraburkholderia tropica]
MLEHTSPPLHPGAILREEIFPSLHIESQQAASRLGVDPDYLERVLLEEAPVTADLALRLEAWLGEERGGRAVLWLSEQATYDLWCASHKDIDQIEPLFEHAAK